MKHLLFATALALAITVSPVAAQTLCISHSDAEKLLKEQYNEVVAARGITGRGSVVELFLDIEDGSWSLIETRPSMLTCFMGGGEGWENIPPIEADKSNYTPA